MAEEATRAEECSTDEQQQEEQMEDFLDVVVASVDTVDGTAMSSLMASSTAGFIVELVVTKGAMSYCIRRSLAALVEVLQTMAVEKDVAVIQRTQHSDADQDSANDEDMNDVVELVQPPEFPGKHNRNDAMIAQWCGEMTKYLAAYSSALKARHEWIEFMEESKQSNGAYAQMTAIEFILQPFQYEKVYIPRGSCHEVSIPVDQGDQFVVWKFEIEEHDVDFTVIFSPKDPSMLAPDRVDSGGEGLPVEVVHVKTRYIATTTGRPIEGMYKCPGIGRATLVWDNSYSRLRGKNILYQVQAVNQNIMNSATAAADALDEAMKAKRPFTPSTALIVSPATPTLSVPAPSNYLNLIPEALIQQSWIVSTPMNVAEKLASRLFGSQPKPSTTASDNLSNDADDAGDQNSSQAKSLLEELNGLNMQLLERLEHLEDNIVKLTVERDQARSITQLIIAEKENLSADVENKVSELTSLRGEIQRMQREREAWRAIQAERDALLEEKHRWAMADDFHVDEGDSTKDESSSDLDSQTRTRLEHELGQAEATVLRVRAELGYSLNNHLTGTSARLEIIAKEMVAAKKEYEDQAKNAEREIVKLKQDLVKYRSQKRVLVTEIRNMKTQTEGQIAVAMAEANEARMVNRRLKKQNELLLTQIRTLIDDANESERKMQELAERYQQTQKREYEQSLLDTSNGTVQYHPRNQFEYGDHDDDELKDTEPESTVPYTLSAADIALLNGHMVPKASKATSQSIDQTQAHFVKEKEGARSSKSDNPYRARLIEFFQEKDPTMLPEVDSMLQSYQGVESMLFDSLELKYSYMEINQRIAQAM